MSELHKIKIFLLFSMYKAYVCPRPGLRVTHTDRKTHTLSGCSPRVFILSPDLKIKSWELSSVWQVLVDPGQDCQNKVGSCTCERRWARWFMNKLKASTTQLHSFFMVFSQWQAQSLFMLHRLYCVFPKLEPTDRHTHLKLVMFWSVIWKQDQIVQ